jgi:outer membrane receptor protein involved in Fe transport
MDTIRGAGFRTLLAAALCVAAAGTAFADGTISGVVIDGLTGQPVRGATIAVGDTGVELSSDIGGSFVTVIAAGTYDVTVTKEGFESQKVTNVVVDRRRGRRLRGGAPARGGCGRRVRVRTSAAFAGEIDVVAEASDSTQAALLSERKNAAQISDAIGAEEMKKNVGSDAADVVKRVTGISVQNNKYVYVRGLGERYSNTALNGSKVPSTEFDKKVVPLDLFPSGLLDKIRVSKSYTVDKPGDFAAGFVELETLDFPVSQTAGIGISTGYNSVSTGEAFARYGDGLDWNGGGGQPAPATARREDHPHLADHRRGLHPGRAPGPWGSQLVGTWRGANGTERDAHGGVDRATTRPTTWATTPTTAAPSVASAWCVSGTHSTEFRSRQDERSLLPLLGSEPQRGGEPEHDFDINYDTETVKKGLVGNLSFRINDNHQLKLRTMLTDLSVAQTMFQDGYFDDISSDIRNYKVDYKDQSVESVQLAGEHFFETGTLGSLLEWRASTSERDHGAESAVHAVRGPDRHVGSIRLSDNATSGFMFFNDLEDTVDDYSADWTTFFSGDNAFGSWKAGVAMTSTDRTFNGRRLRFKHRNVRDHRPDPGARGAVRRSLHRVPTGSSSRRPPAPPTTTRRPTTSRRRTPSWTGTTRAWRFIGGVRWEDSDIEVISQDRFNPDSDPIVSKLEETEWLPALGVVYRLSDSQNLRFNASQTVNRPEFRELAPFTFTDAIGYFERTGNPDLVSAKITSYDARWEWFPTARDVFAVSLFYKDFKDPIESVIVEAVTARETWENAEKAENMGLELEARRNLSAISPALEPWTVILNYSYIDSEITLDPDSSLTNPTRALVGQPDHVGNFVLEWAMPDWGSSVRLMYNYQGSKVAFAAADGLPDVIEEARSIFDIAYRQGFNLFGLDWTVKLSGENLGDETWEWTQGEEPWHLYQPGTKYGLSFSLSFF